MSEDEAKDWLRDTFGAVAFTRLERFVEILLAASAEQNLIARSTVASVWARHIADSAQLVALADAEGAWLDIGSGAGMPGLVVALLRDALMVLCEPRGKRAAFLSNAVSELGVQHCKVYPVIAQRLPPAEFNIISARAVARIELIFAWADAVVSRETRFLLPRGVHHQRDLAQARRIWQGEFHVEQSITDPAAGIVVARDVRRR